MLFSTIVSVAIISLQLNVALPSVKVDVHRPSLNEFKRISEETPVENFAHTVQTENAPTIDYLSAQDWRFMGYFCIPGVSINLPIYHIFMDAGQESTDIAQAYTDRENAATLLDGWTPYSIVADHVNQGFGRLPEVKVGDIAFIQWCDNTRTEYVCSGIGIGINDGQNLYDEAGRLWQEWECDLMAYTCNHAFTDGISYTLWRRK